VLNGRRQILEKSDVLSRENKQKSQVTDGNLGVSLASESFRSSRNLAFEFSFIGDSEPHAIGSFHLISDITALN
jgi:hypothetical protein